MAMFTDNEMISTNTIRSNHFTDHLFITLGMLALINKHKITLI